ncbi:MAG: hypothetical protein ACRENP_25425 [Longimicrobiales bacterium]
MTVRDSAEITIVHNDLARLTTTCAVGSAPAVSIGEAEGREEYELYRVFGATRLSDGRIVLVNQGSQQIRYYDQTGKFVGQAGRPGEGPGEFRDAFYLWALPGDTVWVGDYRPWQFHVFAPNGTYLRTVRPSPQYLNPPGVLVVLDDGRAVLADRSGARRSQPFELEHMTVVVHGPDGVLTDTLGTYANGRYGQIGDDPNGMFVYPLFESFARVMGGGARIVVGHSASAQLALFNARGGLRLDRIIRWTTEDRTISADDVDAERRRLAEPYKDMDATMRTRFLEPLISTKRPVADQMPAFASVLSGKDGRVWVREFQRPTVTGPARWHAFDAEGRFACTATLPDVDQVLEIGADYLLVKDQDESQVERVLQYALSAPARAL